MAWLLSWVSPKSSPWEWEILVNITTVAPFLKFEFAGVFLYSSTLDFTGTNKSSLNYLSTRIERFRIIGISLKSCPTALPLNMWLRIFSLISQRSAKFVYYKNSLYLYVAPCCCCLASFKTKLELTAPTSKKCLCKYVWNADKLSFGSCSANLKQICCVWRKKWNSFFGVVPRFIRALENFTKIAENWWILRNLDAMFVTPQLHSEVGYYTSVNSWQHWKWANLPLHAALCVHSVNVTLVKVACQTKQVLVNCNLGCHHCSFSNAFVSMRVFVVELWSFNLSVSIF